MDQKRFLELLRDPKAISKDDAAELLELRNNFPYFQISHVLSTLAAFKTNNIYFEDLLKKSALTTIDRRKLKKLLEISKSDTKLVEQPPEPAITTTENISMLKTIEESVEQSGAEIEKIDLDPSTTEDRSWSKDAEASFLEVALTSAPEALSSYETPTEELLSTDTQAVETAIVPKDPYESKVVPEKDMFHTILQERAIDSYRQQDHTIVREELNVFNDLISDLLENASQAPKNNSQSLIDTFLLNPPRPKKATFIQDDEEEREDLSEKYTSNSSDFFSESLANIYTKQGKYAKAIETYKKLILTYPQKSAYFASKIIEIENLQK